jgi:hypothetical protein
VRYQETLPQTYAAIWERPHRGEASSQNRKTEEQMGKISRDLDVEINRAAALLTAHLPMHVPGNGFVVGPHGGPVQGVATVLAPNLNAQMDAIYRCLKEIADAVKQLDDQLNPNT